MFGCCNSFKRDFTGGVDLYAILLRLKINRFKSVDFISLVVFCILERPSGTRSKVVSSVKYSVIIEAGIFRIFSFIIFKNDRQQNGLKL